MIPTPSGEMRYRVSWLKRTIENVKGTLQPDWETVGTYWAKLVPVSDGESIRDNQVESQRTYEVIMRYVGEIKPQDKLVYNGRTLNISSVINVEELNAEYKLTCVEVQNR